MAAAEERYNIKLTTLEVDKLKNVGELLDLINAKHSGCVQMARSRR